MTLIKYALVLFTTIITTTHSMEQYKDTWTNLPKVLRIMICKELVNQGWDGINAICSLACVNNETNRLLHNPKVQQYLLQISPNEWEDIPEYFKLGSLKYLQIAISSLHFYANVLPYLSGNTTLSISDTERNNSFRGKDIEIIKSLSLNKSTFQMIEPYGTISLCLCKTGACQFQFSKEAHHGLFPPIFNFLKLKKLRINPSSTETFNCRKTAHRKIKNRQPILNLSQNFYPVPRLTKLPCMTHCPTLTELFIKGHKGLLIPEDSQFPESLKQLSIKNCDLKEFPKKILYCKNLTLLDLSHNTICQFPATIFNFSPLVSLDLSHNCAIIESGGDLAHTLKYIKLEHMNLKEIPLALFNNSIKRYFGPKYLSLAHNNITSLSYKVVLWNTLELLDITHNKMTKIETQSSENACYNLLTLIEQKKIYMPFKHGDILWRDGNHLKKNIDCKIGWYFFYPKASEKMQIFMQEDFFEKNTYEYDVPRAILMKLHESWDSNC